MKEFQLRLSVIRESHCGQLQWELRGDWKCRMESSWQDQCFTLKERFRKIMETDFMSDMNFVIGRDKIKIPAHRLIVSCASYELAKIVEKLTPEANDVPISGTTPAIFHIFLEYIYTGDIVIGPDDEVNMIYVWQLAKRFAVKDLELECLHFLRNVLASDQSESALKNRTTIHLCLKAQSLDLDGVNGMPLKNVLDRVLHLTTKLKPNLLAKCMQNLQITNNNTAIQLQEKNVQKPSLKDILASEKLSKLFIGQKFSDIIVHEESVKDCELQFQPNQQIHVIGFGVFTQKNEKLTGVLSIERLDAKNWDWIDHKFLTNYKVFERFDYDTHNEVVFIKIFPSICAMKNGTYRLIFRETNGLIPITGQENITLEFPGNKENFAIDFRTKYESFSENSIPLLLFETNNKDAATQTIDNRLITRTQRGILRELSYN